MSAESSGSGSCLRQQFPRSMSLLDIFVCAGLIEAEFFCSQAPIEMGSSMHLRKARPDILSLKWDLFLLLFVFFFNSFTASFELIRDRNSILLVKRHKATPHSLWLDLALTLLRSTSADVTHAKCVCAGWLKLQMLLHRFKLCHSICSNDLGFGKSNLFKADFFIWLSEDRKFSHQLRDIQSSIPVGINFF